MTQNGNIVYFLHKNIKEKYKAASERQNIINLIKVQRRGGEPLILTSQRQFNGKDKICLGFEE